MRWSAVFASVVLVGCVTEPLSPFEEVDPDTFPEDEPAVEFEGTWDEDVQRCGSWLDADEADLAELEFQEDLDALHGPGMPAIPAVNGGVINVYFHVIHNGNTGNLTQNQVNTQISIMNQAYAGTGWSFTLRNTDWTNNSTYFTMRDGSTAESNAKHALRQGSCDDLNLYSAKPSNGILGWSTFPNSCANRQWDDGVVFDYRSMSGGSINHYNQGDTVVHEVGHWMGLYHTFQGGCRNTATSGDYVTDTPAERSANYYCPANRDTCSGGGADPVHNYMDYSYDSCMYEFTSGQDSRMDSQFSTYRYGH